MIAALLLGLGGGVGLWVITLGLVPPRPALGTLLHRADAGLVDPDSGDDGGLGWAGLLGRPAARVLRGVGLPGARLRRDLGVLDTPVSGHLAEKAVLAVLGLLTPGVVHLLLMLLGAGPPWPVPIAAAVVLSGLGFVVPDLRVRREAAARREEFRHALSVYLDLVWITLAGGAGVDGALHQCAAIGHGWAFTRLRRALDDARLLRGTPWATLKRLGDDLDITELTDLAATISLAGHEGARVRTSVAAKAQALRTRQLTAAEGQAQAATERMSLPVMCLFLGFLVFIGYPALTHVLTGL
ncbi:Flp pilus assembly protein TadB [Actinoalloteichus hoggarensis]|uniref:Bacterial type II secretion system protein F domain protein n=1 Tax=Actinoalloteichus hoggarensis TaxID=1470176 RepID=A0A221W6K9_9PSEU|nr:type II secretion system F family protein [Actinoalloteichus hoggarensis]ASO21600.1 Bacterial type II secretion system protein F domain protein [Actinoalloteichus hoggarensis]MBB5922192.1 Flp pilus assembly protein TadB [Actinoalloteichus hoggarensis]